MESIVSNIMKKEIGMPIRANPPDLNPLITIEKRKAI